MSPRYVGRLRRPRFRGIRTPVVTARDSAARLALIGLVSAALVIPVWAVTTQTEAGQRLADLILYGRISAAPTVLGAARDTVGSVSLAMGVIAALGLVTLALARGGPGLAAALVVLLGGANVTTQLLHDQLGRPDLLAGAAYATGNSFPSGHVTLVASLALASLLVVPRGLRTPVAVVVAALIAAVGTSTITAGWHRLADVVGGILIALAWAALATSALVVAQGWMPRQTWRRGLGGGATTAAAFAGAAALLAGGLGLGLVIGDAAPLTDLVESGSPAARTFVAAVTISAGVACLAVAVFVWAMRGVALELPPGA
jgi:membrane-associated phospholipid phosphatase